MAVTPTLSEPCAPWPLDTTCLPEDWVAPYTADQLAAVEISTEILWRLTAGRFGLCDITLRPCRKSCVSASDFVYHDGTWTPYVLGGSWFNISCSCSTSCGCGPICEIDLPGPVNSVSEVLIDGVTVNPDTYRVDDARRLVRVGSECWPECQNLALPTTDVGTFSVTYERGIPVPLAGRRAMSIYAVELWKACTNARGCKLPQRVQEITREGLSMTLIDPMDFLDSGKTGLPQVDIWLSAVNPTGRRDVSRVYSPDVRRGRRQTWP